MEQQFYHTMLATYGFLTLALASFGWMCWESRKALKEREELSNEMARAIARLRAEINLIRK